MRENNLRDARLIVTVPSKKPIVLTKFEKEVLDSVLRYDKNMRVLFANLRILLSFLYPNSKPMKKELLQEIENYLHTTFLPKFLAELGSIQLLGDGSPVPQRTADAKFFTANKAEGRMLSVNFARAFVETIFHTIAMPGFKFDPTVFFGEIEKSISLQFIIINRLHDRAEAFARKIPLGSEIQELKVECKKILAQIEPPQQSYRGRLNPISLNGYAIITALLAYASSVISPPLAAACLTASGTVILFQLKQEAKKRNDYPAGAMQNILYLSLLLITLYSADVLNFKHSACLFMGLSAALVAFDLKNAKDSGEKIIRQEMHALTRITSLTTKSSPDPSPFFTVSEIKFAVGSRPPDLKVDQEKSIATDEVKKVRIKRRPDVVIPPLENDLSAEVKTMHFTEIDPSALYDPQDPLRSTVFPCDTFGIMTFLYLTPELVSDLEQYDKPAATKFKELAMSAKSATMQNQQGVKLLKGTYLIDSNGKSIPCFELKPLGKQGNKRLLGAEKLVKIGEDEYRVIIFSVFVPNAHQGKNLTSALTQLQKEITQSSSARIRLA